MLGNDRMIYRRGASQSATFVVAASDSLHQGYADYVCDGTDDQVQIQAAIDALPSGGGEVVLMGGNYLISDTIELNSNVTFQGSGWNTIIKAKDNFGTNDVIYVTEKSGIGIYDLAIDGNFANNPRSGGNDDQNGIWLHNCTDSIIERCYIHDTPDDGVAVTHGSERVFVTNNRIENAHWHAIMFWLSVSRCTAINNIIDGSDIIVERAGVGDVWSYNCVVVGNIIRNSLTDGIVVLDSKNVVISSNIVIGSTYTGVKLDCPNIECTGVVISNNIFRDCASYGIRFFGDVSHTAIANNIIHDCTGGLHLGNVVTMNDVSLIANHIYDITSHTIYDLKGTNFIISENMFPPSASIDINDISGVAIRNNIGFTTENSGTATIVSDATSIVVDHGLDVTPAAGDIMVTPMGSLGSASFFYIDTYTSTQFTIHTNADPGVNVDFAWKAIVL